MHQKCKYVNIVWIERGILITIIKILNDNYKIVKNKNIIIESDDLIVFLKKLYKNLTFSRFTTHNSHNFYINIRHIIKQQDYIIDYIKNYNDYINTDEIYLVPWHDMNDPLIMYKYNHEIKKKIGSALKIIKKFELCEREKFDDTHFFWDSLSEYSTLKSYCKNNNKKIKDILDKIDAYLSAFTDISHEKIKTIVEPYYVEQQTFIPSSCPTIPTTIPSDETLNLLEKHIKSLNDVVDVSLKN